MKRLLYIGELIDAPVNGGDRVNMRNIEVLKEVYGGNFSIYHLQHVNKIVTFFNLLQGNVGTIRTEDYRKITRCIDLNQIDIVFLWSSKLGRLARKLKKRYPKLQVVVFFHNVESHYSAEELRVLSDLRTRFLAQVVKYNESLCVRWADVLITLNRRDSDLLQQVYGRKATFQLPTSFDDHFDSQRSEQYAPLSDDKWELLFVGYHFFANVQGLNWFIEKVLPKMPKAHLTIVGKNMEQVFVPSEQVEVHGFVEDLSDYYYRADVVVLPILSGGGMKTKTAEALMYGCAIVGTSEAFEGYELDPERVGGLANDAETMIEKIAYLCQSPERICVAKSYARELFMKKYTVQASINILKHNLES